MRNTMNAEQHFNRALDLDTEAKAMVVLGDLIAAEYFRRETNWHLACAANLEREGLPNG